ncbi:MAG: aromatic ring-hydroxylating dioxygenase subunit alpha [Proteobacteria bacterium]|nr:aromatic ring-hydroxylating dioxygenase subunit alpha [Pseudomonadota bacterium]
MPHTPELLESISRLDRDPHSLSANHYTDDGIMKQEWERIFAQSWLFAGYSDQLRQPGDYITCMAGNDPVVVVRDESGVLRAFYNICRHRRHILMKEAAGNVRGFVCPYHAWGYVTDGSLRSARHSGDVAGFEPGAFGLVAVRVEIFCGMVFVCLGSESPPVAACYPGLEEELRAYEPGIDDLHFVFRREVTIEANWKLVVENYNENYHTPVVHPALRNVLTSDYIVTPRGSYISHEARVNPEATEGFDATTIGYERHLNWWLWPNLCLMSIPQGGFRVLNIMPEGPGRTRETYDFYLPYSEPNAQQWQQILFACDTVNVEDIGVCEAVQRGQASRSFDRGRMMVDLKGRDWSEHAVVHFRNLVLDALA